MSKLWFRAGTTWTHSAPLRRFDRSLTAVFIPTRSFSAQNTLNEVTGPPLLPIIGNLHNFDVNQIMTGNLRPTYEKYGSIFKINMVGTELIFLSDVDMAREVLRERAHDFTNGDSFRNVFGSLFPTSVIVVEGAQWQRVRRILQRAVQGTRVSEIIRPMCGLVDLAARLKIQQDQPCDVHRMASNITFDTFGMWAYGVELNMIAGENADLLDACETVSEALNWRLNKLPIPFLWQVPTPFNRRVSASLNIIRSHAARLLDLARQRLSVQEVVTSKTNLLDAMVLASLAEEDTKNRLTDEELIDNMSTVFFGAYDTTSATLAFTLNFLAENQEAQELLAAELSGINLKEISREELEALSYLDMVAKEANRLRSTAFAIARTAKVDTQVGNYRVPAGTNVIIDHTSLTARNPELWGNQEDLEKFRPHRWQEVKPHRLASLPFGFGTRMCIGIQVATVEHKIITAKLVQRYRWQTDPGRPLKVTSKIGIVPQDGCWLVPSLRI